jgi:hypothetical protein
VRPPFPSRRCQREQTPDQRLTHTLRSRGRSPSLAGQRRPRCWAPTNRLAASRLDQQTAQRPMVTGWTHAPLSLAARPARMASSRRDQEALLRRACLGDGPLRHGVSAKFLRHGRPCSAGASSLRRYKGARLGGFASESRSGAEHRSRRRTRSAGLNSPQARRASDPPNGADRLVGLACDFEAAAARGAE